MSRGQQILDEEDENESLSKLTSLLDQLAQRYSTCSTLDLGFDPGEGKGGDAGDAHACMIGAFCAEIQP